MWCSFNQGSKKKTKQKNGVEVVVRQNLEAVKEVERSIDERVKEMFSKASEGLIRFLEENRREKEEDEIPTAVVCCNFAHVDILRESVQAGLDASTQIFTIGRSSSSVRTVIDEARREKNGVFLIEQLESLDADFIERLVYLIKWFDIRHPLVVCLSTDIASFSSMCSLGTLSRLNAEIFEMPEPAAIYSSVIACLLEKCNEKEFFLSGDCLSLLRSRFFGTGFCVEQMKRSLRICVQQNAWERMEKNNNDWEEFVGAVNAYWENLQFYCEYAGVSVYSLHEDVQTERKWGIRQFDHDTVTEWLGLPSVSQETKEQMQKGLQSFKEAAALKKAKPSVPAPATPSTGKMTLAQLRQKNEMEREARMKEMQSDPAAILRDAFTEFVSSLLVPWTSFPGHEKYLISAEPASHLYCDPAELVENALMAEENKHEPLAIAYRTLQLRQNWKSCKISDWLGIYEAQAETIDKKNVVPSFYASVGQLEAMGVVKSAGERNKNVVTIIHHPMNHVAN